MLLHDGMYKGQRIVKPETVASMGENQIGALPAGVMTTSVIPSDNQRC